MKWTNDRSKNVEDRRGKGGKKGMMIGGGLGTIVMALVVMFLGGDPSAVLNSAVNQQPATEQRQLTEKELKVREMVEMLTAEMDETWTGIFAEHQLQYRSPKVVLFEEATHSGCGTAQAAMGPFYCPADETMYMDMSFFNELQSKYGAKVSEFTVAYVMAHEFGHHIQHVLGTLQKVEQAKRSGEFTKREGNLSSVAVELQADFYAGVWARKTNDRENFLEMGDLDAAISAAEAVGDDNIQQRSQGYVQQESFTHGSSAQRKEWFMRGYQTGDIAQGNTFKEIMNR